MGDQVDNPADVQLGVQIAQPQQAAARPNAALGYLVGSGALIRVFPFALRKAFITQVKAFIKSRGSPHNSIDDATKILVDKYVDQFFGNGAAEVEFYEKKAPTTGVPSLSHSMPTN
jgi:hypothetical protein